MSPNFLLTLILSFSVSSFVCKQLWAFAAFLSCLRGCSLRTEFVKGLFAFLSVVTQGLQLPFSNVPSHSSYSSLDKATLNSLLLSHFLSVPPYLYYRYSAHGALFVLTQHTFPYYLHLPHGKTLALHCTNNSKRVSIFSPISISGNQKSSEHQEISFNRLKIPKL